MKVNYTRVELSAVDDFIGRGDRSIGHVILRAWELGSLNYVWWTDLDTAYKAWCEAIEEAGLTWKYRQVGTLLSIFFTASACYR